MRPWGSALIQPERGVPVRRGDVDAQTPSMHAHRGGATWAHSEKVTIYRSRRRPQKKPNLLPPHVGLPASRIVRKYIPVVWTTQSVALFKFFPRWTTETSCASFHHLILIIDVCFWVTFLLPFEFLEFWTYSCLFLIHNPMLDSWTERSH